MTQTNEAHANELHCKMFLNQIELLRNGEM